MTVRNDNLGGEPGLASRMDTRAEIRCSGCGEEEALHGKREGGYIRIKCHRCGNSWYRYPRRVCPTCGQVDLIPSAQRRIEKVRGNQTPITGARTVYRCSTCDAASI